jgi:hypothetical protein
MLENVPRQPDGYLTADCSLAVRERDSVLASLRTRVSPVLSMNDTTFKKGGGFHHIRWICSCLVIDDCTAYARASCHPVVSFPLVWVDQGSKLDIVQLIPLWY